ncbi:MAG: Y-family DNA polymerase [Caulobacteraceae bacterium]
MGLFIGQKAADAQALVPGLAIGEAEPDADAADLLTLCDWCERFSPAVAPDPPDGFFFDIAGLSHLWGGEAALGSDLARRLGQRGLAMRWAIAGTAGAAFALARHGRQGARVPLGGEAEALEGRPLDALRLDAALAAQLVRLGIATIGDLSVLPRAELSRRFGGEVLRRLDQALGAAGEALAFRRPPTPWFERLALAEPISAPEDMARVARDIVRRLCARLEAQGLGARGFDLAFHRLDGHREIARVGLAVAGRDPARIVSLLLPRLEGIDPGLGVEFAALAAADVEPMEEKNLRLDDRCDPQEALAPLIDRLANRLGEKRVWREEAFPSHTPERAVRRRPPLSPPAGKGWDAARPRPVRLLARPEPIEAMAPVPDDPPVLFRWRGKAHRVRRAEGPERLAQEWWRAPFEKRDPARIRDYYQVEDEAGFRFWIFRAGLYDSQTSPRWWLHGFFG